MHIAICEDLEITEKQLIDELKDFVRQIENKQSDRTRLELKNFSLVFCRKSQQLWTEEGEPTKSSRKGLDVEDYFG